MACTYQYIYLPVLGLGASVIYVVSGYLKELQAEKFFMKETRSVQWVGYLAAALGVGYATYKYFKYDRKNPKVLKDEGTALYSKEMYEEALKKYLMGLKIVESREGGAEDREIEVKLRNNISQTYLVMKKYEECREYAEQTLKLNPLHMNTFKRLATMEKIKNGYGGVKGICVITAYIVLLKNRPENKPEEKPEEEADSEIKEWYEVLNESIDAVAEEKRKMLETKDTFAISLIKLEEILEIFRNALADSSFGKPSAEDEKLLAMLDKKQYAHLIKYLEKKSKNSALTRRGKFVVGGIKFVQERHEEAIEILNSTGNTYGAVFALYIQRMKNIAAEISKEQIASISAKKHDPIIRLYLAQIQFAGNNLGEYFANISEMQNEETSPLPFIAGAKALLSLNEHAEAVSTALKALSLFPEDLNTLCAAIEILSQAEIAAAEKDAKIQELVEKLSQRPYQRSPRCQFFRYIGISSLGLEKEAEEALEKAIALDPYSSSLLTQQGHMLISKGEEELGISKFEQAAEISPEKAAAIYKPMVVYQSIKTMEAVFPSVSQVAEEKASKISQKFG